MADMGQASRAVILELAKYIEQFNEIITKEIADMLMDAQCLSSCWNDPQYKEFLEFTEQITRQLKSDISTLESVHYNLKIIADKF